MVRNLSRLDNWRQRASATSRSARPDVGGDEVWTASFVGLVVYTMAIVTIRFKVAEIGIGIAILGVVLSKERFRLPAFVWLYILYFSWAFVSSLFSSYVDQALDSLEECLKLLLIMIVAVNALRRPAQIRIYICLILIFFLIYPFRGAMINYFIGHTAFGRAIWNYTYSNPNDLAGVALLVLGIALSMGMQSDGSRKMRLVFFSAVVVLTVLILLTQSRGAFIGLAIGLAIPLLRAAWGVRGALLAMIASVALLVVAVPNDVWLRLAGISKLTSADTIADADPEGSAEQRFEIAKVAWQITLDNPVLGSGLASFPFAQHEYAPELGYRDTHNTYLNLSAELGLPGLALWMACIVSALRRGIRVPRTDGVSSLGFEAKWIQYGLYSFLIAGVFGTYSRINLLYIMLAICWCTNELLFVEPSPAGRPVERAQRISRA